MSKPQVEVEGTLLDNGSWRKLIGGIAFVSDDAGSVETLAVEFIIEADTAAQFDARWQETRDAFRLLNPRVKAWVDSSETLPTEDWYIQDGRHLEIHSTITELTERSQTQRKKHCMLTVAAVSQKDFAAGSATSSTSPANLPGLATDLEISRVYMNSERFTIAVSGVFKETVQEASSGPFVVSSVTSQSGKARFTCSGSPSLPTFEAGMAIVVTGTTSYNGVHIVTAVDDSADTIDTKTLWQSDETGLTASVTFNTVTTAEENYESARSTILTDILGVASDGAPNATSEMVLVAETRALDSQRNGLMEFTLAAGPQGFVSSVTDTAGDRIERGLNFQMQVTKPGTWDESWTSAPLDVAVSGTISVRDTAEDEKELYAWWTDNFLPAIKQEIEARLGVSGDLVVKGEDIGIDYVTKELGFNLMVVAGYNGTLIYSRKEQKASELQYNIFEDTEGYDHVQRSAGFPRKSVTVVIEWTGEGDPDLTPSPPSEAGFSFFGPVRIGESESEPLTLPDGKIVRTRHKEYTYVRIRTKASGGSASGPASGGASPSNPVTPGPSLF